MLRLGEGSHLLKSTQLANGGTYLEPDLLAPSPSSLHFVFSKQAVFASKMQSLVGSWELPTGMLGPVDALPWKPSQSMQNDYCVSAPRKLFPFHRTSWKRAYDFKKNILSNDLFYLHCFGETKWPPHLPLLSFLSFALVIWAFPEEVAAERIHLCVCL